MNFFRKKQVELDLKLTQNHLRAVLDSITGNHWWKDKEGRYQGCNKMTADVIGLTTPDEIIGKTDFDMPWSKQADLLIKNDRLVMSSKKTMNFEEFAETSNGTVFLLTTKAPLFDEKGNVIGVVGTSVDITKLKKQEAELIKAREEAEVSDKLKSEFISNMEHDIRTPFVGIYGMVDLLAQQETNSEKKTILKEIAACAKELLDYCDSILDFSRIEAGSFPVVSKCFALRKLIESVMAIEMAAAKNRGLTLSLDYDNNLPDVVIGDPYRLKRILINLLSNSIKFTKKGYVKLIIALEKKEEEPRKVIIKFIVKDTGIGIPAEKKMLIYERFTKLTQSNKGLYKGLGLGLRIVKQFVDELDGDIYLDSKMGEGSTFSLYLSFKVPLSNDIIDLE